MLAVYAFAQLTSSPIELWVAFGPGKHYRLIPAQKICATIGLDKCLALPMFHAFTGCDTVSCFSGRGKRTAWDTWNMYREITGQFASLMKKPKLGDVDAAMDTVERFVVLLDDKTNTGSEVNMVRFDLFARKGRDVNNIPPTKGALLQHARRAAYQAGHCWSQAVKPPIAPKRAAGWGWVGTELMEASGTLRGVTSQKQAKCAENCCAGKLQVRESRTDLHGQVQMWRLLLVFDRGRDHMNIYVSAVSDSELDY